MWCCVCSVRVLWVVLCVVMGNLNCLLWVACCGLWVEYGVLYSLLCVVYCVFYLCIVCCVSCLRCVCDVCGNPKP